MSLSIPINPSPRPQAWHNPLPDWVTASPSYGALTPGQRAVLQAIADRGEVTRDGITGAFGGKQLALQAGVSIATMWRAITRLEVCGLITTLGVGGTCRGGGGHNYANCYGIPARPGSLDTRRRARRMQRMVRDGSGYRPDRIDPGQQAEFEWGQNANAPDAPEERSQRSPGTHEMGACSGAGPCQNDTRGRVNLVSFCDGGVCQNDTPPSPCLVNGGESVHNPTSGARPPTEARRHGGPARGRALGDAGSLRRVTREDLTSDITILTMTGELIAAGLVSESDQDLVRVFAAAEHALRVGRVPGKLFAATVRRRLWRYLSERDLERGSHRAGRLIQQQTDEALGGQNSGDTHESAAADASQSPSATHSTNARRVAAVTQSQCASPSPSATHTSAARQSASDTRKAGASSQHTQHAYARAAEGTPTPNQETRPGAGRAGGQGTRGADPGHVRLVAHGADARGRAIESVSPMNVDRGSDEGHRHGAAQESTALSERARKVQAAHQVARETRQRPLDVLRAAYPEDNWTQYTMWRAELEAE